MPGTKGALRTIDHCEVCDGATLIPVLDLGPQPLCDDLIPIGETVEASLYPVELLACPTCYTVHQKYQVKKTLLFPQSYHYRAALTQDVLDGMRELCKLAEKEVGDLSDKVVVDIGCNDGSLLNIFKQQGGAKTTIGIEPTGAAHDAVDRVDYVIHDYFGPSAVETYLANYPQPDIITFTNVFAHIDDLNGLIASLKALATDQTAIIIENHYLGAVMMRHQFDTFYHEHPRTYSFRSFEYIAKKLGMNIIHVDFPERYNGNIRVVMKKSRSATKFKVDEQGFIDGFAAMNHYIDASKQRVMSRIDALVKQHGPLPAKAFPGRASIIVNYFGIDERTISTTFERSGSMKIGNYIPGCRIPILDEAELFSGPTPPAVINLAWHIKKEIHQYMRTKGYKGEIIEVFS